MLLLGLTFIASRSKSQHERVPAVDGLVFPPFRIAEIPKFSLSEILLTSGPVITTVASTPGHVVSLFKKELLR